MKARDTTKLALAARPAKAGESAGDCDVINAATHPFNQVMGDLAVNVNGPTAEQEGI